MKAAEARVQSLEQMRNLISLTCTTGANWKKFDYVIDEEFKIALEKDGYKVEKLFTIGLYRHTCYTLVSW